MGLDLNQINRETGINVAIKDEDLGVKYRVTAIVEISGDIVASEWVEAAERFIKSLEVREITRGDDIWKLPKQISNLTSTPLRVLNTVERKVEHLEDTVTTIAKQIRQ